MSRDITDWDSADDGFGNLLYSCGSWYNDKENLSEPLPEGTTRRNNAGVWHFAFDDGYAYLTWPEHYQQASLRSDPKHGEIHPTN